MFLAHQYLYIGERDMPNPIKPDQIPNIQGGLLVIYIFRGLLDIIFILLRVCASKASDTPTIVVGVLFNLRLVLYRVE